VAEVDAGAAPVREFFPMSAHSKTTSSACWPSCSPTCPSSPWFYDGDMLTDRSERFLVSEIIREKLFRLTATSCPTARRS
jgi:GTP-binding protein Era